MLLVKKYPNRRLYDTQGSRYITLDDLAQRIREGSDVVVQDAQTGRDLTQETLTQIILDRGGGRILPTTLLVRLIRLDDEALGEFMTRYVGWALEVYVQAKGRARALLPLNPLATAPFAATDALARLMLGATSWGAPPAHAVASPDGVPAPPEVMPSPEPPPPVSRSAPGAASASSPADEIARMRRELDELKAAYAGGRPAASRKKNGGAKRPKRKGSATR